MDVNERSRIFIDVSSKLLLLSNARRLGKAFKTFEELKEMSKNMKDECLLVKIKNLHGYILLCDGEPVAAAFQQPPALGERALALIGEDPMKVELYAVSKEVVRKAEEKLGLVEQAQRVGQKLGEVLVGLSTKRKGGKKEEVTKEIEIPEAEEEIEVMVPPLEVLELIDLVTLSDEVAYYLEREGIEAESDTPESINGNYVIKIHVKSPVEIDKLVEALYHAAKRSEANTLIQVNLPGGSVYYFDPILYEGFNEVMRRFGVTDKAISYIELSGDKATINVSLKSTLPPHHTSRIIASLVNVARRRKLPWKNMNIVVRAGPMTLMGEI